MKWQLKMGNITAEGVGPLSLLQHVLFDFDLDRLPTGTEIVLTKLEDPA